jgi:CRP-like cAMP-binding protein
MDQLTLRAYINKLLELPEEDMALLISCVSARQLKKGEALLREGEICNGFYLVDKGYLRTYFNKDGVPINLHFTFEGNYTSNLKSRKFRLPSELTIEAGEDTSVWVFNFDGMAVHLNAHPQIGKFFRRLTLSLLLALEEHSEIFKIYTPTERYHYIEKNNPKLLQRISLSQIASYLGVTRETLSRIRGRNH